MKYVPTAETTPADGWHTTPGGSRGAVTNDMESVNTHAIHVFAKGVKLRKMDAELARVLTGAEFMLYRRANSGETENARRIGNADYVPASEFFTVDNNGIADIGFVPAGDYYLVETRAPEGYLPAAPMQVVLTLRDTFAEVPRGNEGLSDRPTDVPYDWTQVASMALGGVAKRSDENWNDSAQVVVDSRTSTICFRIPNNSGAKLPATGGAGAELYRAIGALLALAALALLAVKRRSRVD